MKKSRNPETSKEKIDRFIYINVKIPVWHEKSSQKKHKSMKKMFATYVNIVLQMEGVLQLVCNKVTAHLPIFITSYGE